MDVRRCTRCHRPARWIVALDYAAPFYVCGYHRRAWIERVCYRLRLP